MNDNNFVGYITNTGVEFNASMSSDGKIGPPGPQGPQGEQGEPGPQGEQGIQGIQGIQGEQGPAGADGQNGQDGQDGYTPVKGTDYFTASDIADFEADVIADLSPTMGSSVDLDINSSTYVMTLSLKNPSGTTISSDSIDLPLESMVVSGSYDSANKKVVLTLQSGSTVEFSVADLVSGLQSEITSSNKLSADLVDDTSTTNKFVTASDITNWNGKQAALTAGSNITITNNEISATDTTYTAGTNISITNGAISTNGDTIKILTGSTIKIWELDPGIYKITGNSSSGVGIYCAASYLVYNAYYDCFLVVQLGEDSSAREIRYFYLYAAPLGTTSVTTDMYVGWSAKFGSQAADGRATAVKLRGLQTTSNLVTSISSSSTNSQYPSAKLLYDQLVLKADATNFTGTDGTTAGTAGLVPAPATTDTDKYLKSDGTWATVQGGAPIATSITSSSTNNEVAGAKAVYDICGNIESILQTLNSGTGV